MVAWVVTEVSAVATDIAGAVLAIAGMFKVVQPAAWVQAVGSFARPLARHRHAVRRAARAFGLAEVGLGVAVLSTDLVAVRFAVAALYGAFAIVATAAWRRRIDCGCFGARSASATPTHVVLNLVAAVALATSIVDRTPISTRLTNGVGIGIAYGATWALATAATIVVMTLGAALATQRRAHAEAFAARHRAPSQRGVRVRVPDPERRVA